MSKNKYGLTGKQEGFCHAFVELGNASEAYRQTYNVREGTPAQTVHSAASRLMSHSKFSARISDLQAAAALMVIYGLADAAEELEQARARAERAGAPAAMVAAIRAKMDLFGLGAKHVKVDTTVRNENLSPERQVEHIRQVIPQLAPILVELGWSPPDGLTVDESAYTELLASAEGNPPALGAGRWALGVPERRLRAAQLARMRVPAVGASQVLQLKAVARAGSDGKGALPER